MSPIRLTKMNSNDFLVHHGIKGQRWGKRNGPPYPLSDTEHNKVVGRKYNVHNNQGDLAFMLARMAADQIHDHGLKKRQTKLEEKLKDETIKRKNGLRVKDREYTEKEDLKKSNPTYNAFIGNANKKNCVFCGLVYEMRRRGYDVEAKMNAHGADGGAIMKRIFPKAKPIIFDPFDLGYEIDKSTGTILSSKIKSPLKDMHAATIRNPFKMSGEVKGALSQSQRNSRGIAIMRWAGSNGGHMCNYKIDGTGKISILDPQTGKVESLNKYASKAKCMIFYRTDSIKDSDINYKEIKEYML